MVETQTPSFGPPADRMVEFSDAISLGFKNYFQFRGRSSRGAYWWWSLAMALVGAAAGVADAIMFGDQFIAAEETGPIAAILSLATFFPSLSVSIRRLHDVNRSGWWLLLIFTIIGIFLLLYWYVQPGDRRANKYGEDAEAGRT